MPVLLQIQIISQFSEKEALQLRITTDYEKPGENTRTPTATKAWGVSWAWEGRALSLGTDNSHRSEEEEKPGPNIAP